MNSFFCMQATVNTQWTTLALVIGWMLTIFVGLLGGIILLAHHSRAHQFEPTHK